MTQPQTNARDTCVHTRKPEHIATAAILIGVALRFLCLGYKSIWLDEGLSIRVAQADWATYLSGSIERYHPPLFFLVLRQAMKIGTSEAILRMPAAIAGSLSIGLSYLLSRKIFDERTAISTTWFAALSPLLVWYSQEIRGYSLLVMCALLSFYALTQLTLRRGWAWWLAMVIAMTAGLYTHYVFVLVLPIQILLVTGLIASKNGTPWASLALMTGWGVTGLLFWPWLRTPAARAFLAQLTSDQLYYNVLTVGQLELPTDWDYSRFALLLGIAAGALLALVTWLFYRLLQRRSNMIVELRDHNRVIRIVLAVLFILVLVVSVVPRGYTLKRYTHVLWFLVPLFFGWTWPWSTCNRSWLKVFIPLALVASLVNVLFIPKEQWKDAARLVLEGRQQGDVVLLAPSWMTIPFGYYNDGTVEMAGLGPQEDPTTKISQVASDHSRVWFIYYRYDTDAAQVDAVQRWLQEHGQQVGSHSFFHLQLYLYQTG